MTTDDVNPLSIRIAPPKAAEQGLGVIETVGADCTCWPEIMINQLDDMTIEINVNHDSRCARLARLKRDRRG
jgi:hypothetical protein